MARKYRLPLLYQSPSPTPLFQLDYYSQWDFPSPSPHQKPQIKYFYRSFPPSPSIPTQNSMRNPTKPPRQPTNQQPQRRQHHRPTPKRTQTLMLMITRHPLKTQLARQTILAKLAPRIPQRLPAPYGEVLQLLWVQGRDVDDVDAVGG